MMLMDKDEEDSRFPFKQGFPEYNPVLDEETVIQLFTKRVEELMRDDLDLLLSSLYRFDVLEEKIQAALHSATVPPAEGIARLILERQKERLKTRQTYSKGNQTKWEGL
jgi:hypothetical protein